MKLVPYIIDYYGLEFITQKFKTTELDKIRNTKIFAVADAKTRDAKITLTFV